MLKRLLTVLLLSIFAVGVVQAEEKVVATKLQSELRSSYPFPEFLSTGPYVWYEDAEKQPTKGHMYRIATFTVDSVYRVYIEKNVFGVDGCCFELVESRELMLTEDNLRKLFPANKGQFRFKLVNWRDATSFIFTAYGGKYLMTDIDKANPGISETTANE